MSFLTQFQARTRTRTTGVQIYSRREVTRNCLCFISIERGLASLSLLRTLWSSFKYGVSSRTNV